MSTSRIGRLVAVCVAAGTVLAGGSACDRMDGMFLDRTDPQLLAEGAVEDARWAVVLVHERKFGDCLELRYQGVVADRRCAAASMLDYYLVGVTVLRGTSQPLIFGVLPEGTARAEIALDGSTDLRPDPKRVMTPIEVRTFGESGRYVVGPAPANRAGSDGAWRDNTTVDIEVYDDQGRELAPR